ncbi:MAG: transketolase [Bacteroidetes bacterium]|nr:transketolase [Bacteroidota bacterium]MBP6402880.1 transketolase [Bacteroidia bacterium]MBP6650336.1 transketolase [Bacteroidia bacterium]
MRTIEELQKIASQVRRDIIRQVNGANSGHPGGSLGCTDFLVGLYFGILNHHPEKFSMDGKTEDLFFLSNGHISPLFYSVLARSGYFDVKELATFRLINSRLQGHPATHEKLPGIRVASGSLGQGISVAIGASLTKKLNGEKSLIYCLCGDGEMEEGQIWEAVMYAGAKKVDNIIVTVDVNNQQIDGSIEHVLPYGDLRPKFESFGWDVLQMEGNNMADVIKTLTEAKARSGKQKPVMILMKTVMGQGVDFMMHTHKWHGVAPNAEQTKTALAQLEETLGDF